MPTATRIPTVKFRSLLLPPIQIPLRAVQALHRPQCPSPIVHAARAPQCLAQRRSLHLYKTARSKTVLGQHKVLTFDEYKVPDLSESDHRVNLIKSETDPTIIQEGLTLQELYDNYVSDGQILCLTGSHTKKVLEDYEQLKQLDLNTELNNYALFKPHQIGISKKNSPAVNQLGALKIATFNLASPLAYARAVLDRSYQFVEIGYPVEFRIKVKGKKLTKAERLQPGDSEVWPWMHNHFPHLRPDFICKAMPEGTKYLIKPWSDGRIVQWILFKPWPKMPKLDLDARLGSVKDSVTKSIQKGKQAQLPSLLRQQLHDEGHKDYSPYTGLPRAQARQKFARGGENIRRGAEEKKRMQQDAETTKFMVPDPRWSAESTDPFGFVERDGQPEYGAKRTQHGDEGRLRDEDRAEGKAESKPRPKAADSFRIRKTGGPRPDDGKTQEDERRARHAARMSRWQGRGSRSNQ